MISYYYLEWINEIDVTHKSEKWKRNEEEERKKERKGDKNEMNGWMNEKKMGGSPFSFHGSKGF